MRAQTHEVIPCTTDPNSQWEPVTAAEAAVMRMLGYPVREIQKESQP